MTLMIHDCLSRMRSIAFLLFIPVAVWAQIDTVALLEPKMMGTEDIDAIAPQFSPTLIRCVTRTPERADVLPFTTWVVTEEDIAANGFVTLGDVLRSVPGVRVSQPGNALEGETFLVRGLPGNQYMRILINDIPIKPSATPGMPIGSQLPIRQAERIEFYFGPATAIWGNEACAGVINIILKETERPIFTRAELNFGNFGYNGLDLSFGGKLGRDRDIFRYSIYGSSTIRAYDVYYDEDLYDPDHYLPFGLGSELYEQNLNFSEVFREDGEAVSPVEHESRLFGAAFKWRGLTFNYNRMTRLEHSAVGLNPIAQSYSNGSNKLGEVIETFSLGFQRAKKRRNVTYNFSVVRYQFADAATSTLVFDRLSSAAYHVRAPFVPVSQQQSLRDSIFFQLASQQRLTLANALDGRAEVLFQTALFKHISMDFGGQFNISNAYAPIGYQRRSVNIPLFGDEPSGEVRPFPPRRTLQSDANLLAQASWRSPKLSVFAGAALNITDELNAQAAPRLGVMYRIDSIWSVYANVSSSFRRPAPYNFINTYRIAEQDPQISPVYEANTQRPERIEMAELGLRMGLPWLESTSLGYFQRGYDLFRNGYLIEEDGNPGFWQYGYARASGLSLRNWGIQQWFVLKDIEQGVDVNNRYTRLNFKAEVLFQYTQGKEWFGNGLPSTDRVRNMPGWTSQVRLSWRSGKFQLTLATIRNRGILSKSAALPDFYQQTRIRDYPKFRTWDVMARIYLSEQFLVYVQVQNLFNRQYAGIDATGTVDDLLYNPQQRRLLRLGVSYNMSDRSQSSY